MKIPPAHEAKTKAAPIIEAKEQAEAEEMKPVVEDIMTTIGNGIETASGRGQDHLICYFDFEIKYLKAYRTVEQLLRSEGYYVDMNWDRQTTEDGNHATHVAHFYVSWQNAEAPATIEKSLLQRFVEWLKK